MYDGNQGVDPGECVVPTVNGESLVFESYDQNPEGTSYVRFIDKNQQELLYYCADEWQQEPQLVMGCIMKCIQRGVNDTN
jgi:hypothetical protein